MLLVCSNLGRVGSKYRGSARDCRKQFEPCLAMVSKDTRLRRCSILSRLSLFRLSNDKKFDTITRQPNHAGFHNEEITFGASSSKTGSMPKNGRIGIPGMMTSFLFEGRGVIQIPPVSRKITARFVEDV